MAQNIKSEQRAPTERGQSGVSIDLRKIYEFEGRDVTLNIDETRYSNLAYIQITPRDLYIDFLEMPGVKSEGRMVARGVRVYMSHVAGQRLSEALGRTLSEVIDKGKIEQLKKK
jgi:hypothetical protein